MQVASLSLCKALYGVSGWGDTHLVWNGYRSRDGKYEKGTEEWHTTHTLIGASVVIDENEIWLGGFPAYDLGYLLRKLQEIAPTLAWMHDEQKWAAITDASFERQDADTPEDAAALLAIELFRQGILKPEKDKQ